MSWLFQPLLPSTQLQSTHSVSFIPGVLKVYQSGVWNTGVLKVYQSGSWVSGILKVYN
jgi:hypothetical protein